jgi:hypothetical protein
MELGVKLMIYKILLPLVLMFLTMNGFAHTGAVVVRAPNNGLVPEVTLDKKGVLHMTYGTGTDGYYVQSKDNGKTFTEPVKINHQAGVVRVGNERGVKLVIGKDGILHLSWTGTKDNKGAWYTRSLDGGRSFEKERNLVDIKTDVDGTCITSDSNGNVFVFWLDGRHGEDPQSPHSFSIYMSTSKDNGKSFSKNTAVKHDHPGRACHCCRLDAKLGEDGYLYLTFRTGYKNVRDFYLLKGRKTENDFKAIRVSVDDWKIEACPHSGAPIFYGKDGKVLVSWMSEDKVYWSTINKNSKSFAPRLPAVAGSTAGQNHPTVVMNAKGNVAIVWKENMDVIWAIYGADGKLMGEKTVAGKLTGRSKPNAFVGTDNNFYVVF